MSSLNSITQLITNNENISPMVKYRCKSLNNWNNNECRVKSFRLSDHNPLIYDNMIFWNIQKQDNDTSDHLSKNDLREKNKRLALIVAEIERINKENPTNIIGLQECPDSLITINGFTRVLFSPKASTRIQGPDSAKNFDKIDRYGCALFVKNDIINSVNLNGEHNNVLGMSRVTAKKVGIIVLNRFDRLATERYRVSKIKYCQTHGKRITNYFNFVKIGDILYVNMHGVPQSYDLDDLIEQINHIENINTIYIGGDFNKNRCSLNKYFERKTINNLIYKGIQKTQPRDGKWIDHVLKFGKSTGPNTETIKGNDSGWTRVQ